jgi:hypothetical protein
LLQGGADARQVSLESEFYNGTQYEAGTVGAGVSRLVIQLSNGSELDLRPVTADGQRWVAFAAPQLAILRAVSYRGTQEYQYAVPFVNRSSEQFVTWLRPGQPGLARATRHLQSGTLDGAPWFGEIETGPWGYCVAFANGSNCLQDASDQQLFLGGRGARELACGPLATSSGHAVGASSGIMVLPANVRYVVLKFADRSQRQFTAVSAGGAAALAYAIPDHPAIVTVLEFSQDRQLLHSGSGAAWGC